MISVPSMNERRVFGQCKLISKKRKSAHQDGFRGVIGPNIRLAKKILLARFAEYRNRARYRDLQEFLASEAFQFTCDCDSRFCSTAGHHTVRPVSFRVPSVNGTNQLQAR